MEQEPGQDPENDGPTGPQLPSDSSHPGDAGSPGPGTSSSGSSGADADADAGTPDEGESVFGPWEALEGTLGAAKEREELLSGFAPGGVWDKHPPGPELAAAVARAVGPDWRCSGGDRRGADRPAARDGLAPVLVGRRAAGDHPGADPRRRPGVPRARSRHGDLPDEWDESLVHEICPRAGGVGAVGGQDDPGGVGAGRAAARGGAAAAGRDAGPAAGPAGGARSSGSCRTRTPPGRRGS